MRTHKNLDGMARFYGARLAGLSVAVSAAIARVSRRTGFYWENLEDAWLFEQDEEFFDLLDVEYRKVLDTIALNKIFTWGFLYKSWL